jgi:hypothetical protein
MNELIDGLIPQVTPTAGAVLALNLVAYLLAYSGVPKRWLPWITAAAGAAIWPFVSDPGKVGYAVRSPVVGQIIMGFMIGATAMWTHQTLLKPLIGKLNAKENEYDEAIKRGPDNPTGGPAV